MATAMEPDPDDESNPLHCTQMGASASVNNRVSIPPRLKVPLDNYRGMATKLPIDQERLEAARKRVRRILEALCHEAGDAAVTKTLSDDVFAHTEDEFIESDSTDFVKDNDAVRFGPQYDGNNTRIPNRNEMQQIVPGLWCGSWIQGHNLEVLRHYGITHVCCCVNTKPLFLADIMYLHIPAVDKPTYKMAPHFAQAFEFIENALVKRRGNVLVHCEVGVSRSPAIVASYLMKKLRISSARAIQLVQHRRSMASPNMGFRDQLHAYGIQLNVDEASASERGALANEGLKQAAKALALQP